MSMKNGKYDFFDFIEPIGMIRVGVRRIDGIRIEDDDIAQIENILNNMGKWEELTDVGIELLKDLRIISENKVIEKYVEEYVREKYNVIFGKTGDYVLSITITLTEEERLRRSRGKRTFDAPPHFPKEEIEKQIRNAIKWKRLVEAVHFLKSI